MHLRFYLLPFFFFALSLQAQEIRISASDLLAEYLEAPLRQSVGAEGLTLQIDSIGSLPALDRLRSNEVDLAIIAVPEGENVPRDDFRVYPFAYEIAVIAVNESNPIDEVSIRGLGGIFGANEELNYVNWGDLGLSGWGNRTIKPLVGQTEEDISLELFKFTSLRGGVLRTSVAIVKDSEVEDLILADAASIAILPRLPKSGRIKTLMVSGLGGGPAFGPTDDNVHFGDYPIRLAFYIVHRARDEEKLRPVLRALLSDEQADALRKNTLFALPDTVRRKLVADLELEN